MRYGMVIDLERCIGCNACTVACKQKNATPRGTFWCKVTTTEEGEYPKAYRKHLPTLCNHCENAMCAKVCPTGATHQREDGIVAVDSDKCIGCRMCMAACPYNARNFNWQTPVRVTGANYGDAEVPVRPKGVAEKCTLCRERTDRGEEPMCVVCCPAHARIFGDLDDPDSEISQTILNRKAWTLLENQGTRPSVHYFE